ncbi:MAG: ATPase central domain-containing protein [Xanthobacteraceae bacterium]|nr:MAG: ATPase central domain-containing protein [Xanthobacteraceae bacterium]
MATAKQMVALIRGHVQRDDEQFLSLALQVAASEARQGRQEIADEIKKLVDQGRSGKAPAAKPIPLARPRAELEDIVSASYPKTKLTDVVLGPDIKSRLERLIRHQSQRAVLRQHGRRPMTHVLLVGPPGTGKTLTASALAGELHLPLFRLRLDTLITRYLGETATKLRLVFDQIHSVRGVYLFDEFDALGTQRNQSGEVGEMRRVLNSFLQFLEEDNGTDSLIVGATNHPELLDRALFRRFGDVLRYDLPTAEEICSLVTSLVDRRVSKTFDWPSITQAATGLSQADIVTAVDDVIKDAILDGNRKVSENLLADAFVARKLSRDVLQRL